MNLYRPIFYLSIIILVFLSCSEKKGNTTNPNLKNTSTSINISESDLLVYGSMNCVHCTDFISKLESKNIPFTFYDVDKSDTKWQDMYKKVQAINYKGYVSFPIVDAKGKIFVNPKIEEVLQSFTE